MQHQIAMVGIAGVENAGNK